MTENYSEDKSSLVSRNITVLGRRTSIRLEPEMWTALRSIADREKCSIHDICSLVSVRKKEATSLTAAIRVFLMLYFQASSTEEGHVSAGHGGFANMIRRARVTDEYFSQYHEQIKQEREEKDIYRINYGASSHEADDEQRSHKYGHA